MTVEEAFKKNAREWFYKRDVTWAKFANMAGMDTGHLYKLLSDKYGGCTLYSAWRVARALDVTLDDLVKGADK